MKLYYHHVGLKGAQADFPKTIFSKVDISLVEQTTADAELLIQLRRNFPSGTFNCWGVPSGAGTIIQNLAPMDSVLLIEQATETGRIPALCEVKVFLQREYPHLSQALWGDNKYSYIFFFGTELLDFSWQEFREGLSFSPNFNPRGQFYVVKDQKLEYLGGAQCYVSFLRSQRALTAPSSEYQAMEQSDNLSAHDGLSDPYESVPHSDSPTDNTDQTDNSITKEQIQSILQTTQHSAPRLVENSTLFTAPVQRRIRSSAFRTLIKEIYKNCCAVCGSNLQSPEGVPEVEAAHIYPKRFDGSDDLRNGLCLCRLHHWAFDCGWFSLTNELAIIVKAEIPASDIYKCISDYDGKTIILPSPREFSPHPLFMTEHRRLFNFQ